MKKELNSMRMHGLLKHYSELKSRAKDLMLKGSFSDYALTLNQINKVRYQLALSARTDF